MSPQQQLPAAMTRSSSTTTQTTSRRTTKNIPPPPPPRKNAATMKSAASSADSTTTAVQSLLPSSSCWNIFNLRIVLLTFLLCMAILHGILQSSAGIPAVIPPASSSTISMMIRNEIIHDDIKKEQHENNMNNETTTSASPFATLEPISRGTAQVRYPVVNDTTTTNIPKIIWLFWDTGWPAKKHPGANMNRRSWELANPTFTVHALDGPTAERLTNRSRHIPDDRWQILHVQAKSDVYRTLLLQKYGGIWADCNVFCNRPVTDWVDLNATDVVSFRRTDNLSEQVKKGIQPWITSWFLAAPPASYIMTAVMRVISDPAEHYRFRAQYFWWHHIVAQIANADRRVQDVIQSYTAPGICAGKNWPSQGTALKRCANKSMPPIIYTTEQCCPAMGGRPHIMSTTTIQNSSNTRMTAAEQQQQELMVKELCSQWNCTVQAENLGRGNAIRQLWGSERIRTLNDDYFDP